MNRTKSPSALPRSHKTATTRQRRYIPAMCIAVLFAAMSIGIVAAFSALLKSNPPRTTNNSSLMAQADGTGTIILHPGTGCQSRIFDNRTGQIFEADGPCLTATPRDVNGVPVPMGTVKTINSISKSFKE